MSQVDKTARKARKKDASTALTPGFEPPNPNPSPNPVSQVDKTARKARKKDSTAPSLLDDSRFSQLFNDPAFQIDEENDDFKARWVKWDSKWDCNAIVMRLLCDWPRDCHAVAVR